MTKILGISAFYHDSAAALIEDGKILAAAQEERFTRQKHTPDFPHHAISYCLRCTGSTIDSLDAVVFYDKPLLKFERLLETYYAFAPKGLASFVQAMPIWLKEKLFLKKLIRDSLEEIESFDRKKLNLLFSEHHMSHAASAFYPSPFSDSAVLTIDGVGEWSTASIGLGRKNELHILQEMQFPHSVGLLYSAFTYFLGFKVNSGEYKLMGLAPYGDPDSVETKQFINIIRSNLVDLKPDGSIFLNQKYFSYASGLRMISDDKWEQLFGISRRQPESATTISHANLALAIQTVTEAIVLAMAAEAKRLTGLKSVCLAGGVALNCVANGRLHRSGLFDQVYIQPAAGDAGGALGAALACYYQHYNKSAVAKPTHDQMRGSYFGPYFSRKEIEETNLRFQAAAKYYPDFEELTQDIAKALASEKIVGWFQGRMEFGPRALGNRSILADPRSPKMQSNLNLKIKYRENFRPFAPAILEEYCQEYFSLKVPSPYMLLTAPVERGKRETLPEDYQKLSLDEKLAVNRSQLPAVTHIDFSARVQTVNKQTNERFWKLLDTFMQQTGCPSLINTSFNVRGEPIVCTPADAFHCFMNTEMDILVVENYVYYKEDQNSQSIEKIHFDSD